MRVYVAGPLSQGNVAGNVRQAILAADRLLAAGHAPFVPHLTHFWGMVCPREYEEWITLDFVWIRCCDALIRLPGESLGADREVVWAQHWNIPVFEGVTAFLEYASIPLRPWREA